MPRKDLNLVKENQNLLCYRYTTGQKPKYLITQPHTDARGGGEISQNFFRPATPWFALGLPSPMPLAQG